MTDWLEFNVPTVISGAVITDLSGRMPGIAVCLLVLFMVGAYFDLEQERRVWKTPHRALPDPNTLLIVLGLCAGGALAVSGAWWFSPLLLLCSWVSWKNTTHG